jgi:hypothetical protein
LACQLQFDADPNPDFYLMRSGFLFDTDADLDTDQGYQNYADSCGSGCGSGPTTPRLDTMFMQLYTKKKPNFLVEIVFCVFFKMLGFYLDLGPHFFWPKMLDSAFDSHFMKLDSEQ